MASDASGHSDVGHGILVNFDDVIFDGVYGGMVGKQRACVKMVMAIRKEWSRTEREIKNLLALGNHENTVFYMASSSTAHPPIFYIAMERCSSNTLSDMVEQGKLPTESHLVIMQHIARGLQHLHSHGIIHRMLTPRHILQSADCKHLKICGFGLSKEEDASSHSISIRRVDVWGAPELYNKDVMDKKSDVYSAGLIFHYIMSNGKHAFGGNNLHIKRKKDNLHIQLNIASNKNFNVDFKEYPNDILAKHLVSRMLEFRPSDRPSAETVLHHPVYWPEDVQPLCTDTVKKTTGDPTLLKALLPNFDQSDKNQSAKLLYATYVWLGKSNGAEITTELLTALEELQMKPRNYEELRNIRFDTSDKSIGSQGQEALSFPDHVVKSKLTEIIDHELCEINVSRPLKSGKCVYPATIKGIINEDAAVKIVPWSESGKENIQLLYDIRGNQNIVSVKRSFEMAFPAQTSVPHEMLRPDSACECIVMERCAKSLRDIISSDPSIEYRKMLAIHMLCAIEYIHSKGIAHRKISEDKFLLSPNGRNLKLLMSKRSIRTEDPRELRGDIQAAMGVTQSYFDYGSPHLDCETGDLLEHMRQSSLHDSATKLLLHPFFWTPNKKLDFLAAIADSFDARETYGELEKHINGCCKDSDWSDALKLKPEEKQKWFSSDDEDFGIVYQKATTMKNETKRKYDTTSRIWLIRLIRNCRNHLLDDCDTERRDNDYPTLQTLFRSREDIWIFFSARFPKLLRLAFSHIQNNEVNHQRRFERLLNEPADGTPLTDIKE